VTRDYAAEYERRVTAYHESGHGVTAVVLDLPLDFVSIVPTSSSGGRCRLAVPLGQLDVLRVCIWTLGGPEAEKVFLRQPRARLASASADYAFVRDLLTATKRDADNLNVLAARYEVLAAAKVAQHQQWIGRVAGALLRHRRLHHEDVLALRDPKELAPLCLLKPTDR